MLDLFRHKDQPSEGNSRLSSQLPSDPMAQINELEIELQRLDEECSKIVSRQSEISCKINALKLSLYKASEVCSDIDKEAELVIEKNELPVELSNNVNYDPIPVIVPKRLKIKNYEHCDAVAKRHYDKLFNISNINYDYHFYGGFFTCATILALTNVGKEVIAVKSAKPSLIAIKETKDIIETLWTICQTKEKGDLPAYNRYVDFLTAKYPIPGDPYTEDEPVDFCKDQTKPLYVNAFYLLYFLTRYAHTYRMDFHQLMRIEPRDVTIGINEIYKDCLISILEFAIHGYSFAIIPIMDENIMYRPQKLAQSNICKSFLYYDDYVETVSLIDSNKVERPEYTFTAGTVVSGHYRSGHYRNGYWVSGHWVNSHYRR